MKLSGYWLSLTLLMTSTSFSAENRPPELNNPNPPGPMEAKEQLPRWDLTPSAAGLAASGGTAELRSATNGTSGPAKLVLQVRGLAGGHYILEGVTKTNGEPFEIARLTILDPTTGPEKVTGEAGKETSNGQQSEMLESRVEVPWPARIDPAHIQRILIRDRSGVVLLIGRVGR